MNQEKIKINDIRSSQDIDYNTEYLRRQRLEYYLLTSLGTRSMYKWLPPESFPAPRAKMISLGGCNIIIKSYQHTNLPYLRALKLEAKILNDAWRQLKCAAKNANIALNIAKEITITDQGYQQFDYLKDKMLNLVGSLSNLTQEFHLSKPTGYSYCVGEVIGQFLSDTPILDALCKAYSDFDGDFLTHLEEMFDCKSESVWQPVHLDKRRIWRKISFHTFSLDGYYKTCWVRPPDVYRHYLSVVSELFPLWRPYGTVLQAVDQVFLTENLPYANQTKNASLTSEEAHPILSWIGRGESINYIDWQCLKEKTVHYILLCDDPSHLQTAAKVKNALTGIAKQVNFVVAQQTDQSPVFHKITDEQFEAHLGEKILNYPVQLYTFSASSQNKQSAVPFSVIQDTKVIPAVNLQKPFPIAESSISIFYAEPGSGKTWFSLSFSFAISAQKPFCTNWHPTCSKKVLYLDGEMGDAGLKERLQYIERMYNIKLENNHNFHAVALNVANINLAEPEGQYKINQYITHEIKDTKNLLIVIDNILSVTQYSDHATHWNSLFEWVKDLRDRKGVTIIFIHHTNKSGKQRGSEIKSAVVDNVIRIQSTREKSGAIRMNLSFEKTRTATYHTPKEFDLSLKLQGKIPHWIDHGKYTSPKDSTLLKQLLAKHNPKMALPIQELMAQTGYSRPAIYQYYRNLKNNQEAQD